MAIRSKGALTANQEHEYTPEQIQELNKCLDDPIYFIKKYVKIQHPTKGSVPFDLWPFQEDFIRNVQQNRFVISMMARQSGKTTLMAAYILWFVCFNDDKTVLTVSNKGSNAMEIIRRIKYAYSFLPTWLRPNPDPTTWTKHELWFDNESRVISEATTDESGRGKSISLLLADEFAHIDAKVVDDFWTSIYPTLSTGGNAVLISTPNGDSNKFAEMWRSAESGSSNFVPLRYDWTEVPGRDESFIDGEIGAMGEIKVRQEYYLEFLTSSAALFDAIALERIAHQIPNYSETSEDKLVLYEPIGIGQVYLVALDPAKGVGKDFSAIEVFKLEGGKVHQVAEYRSNTIRSGQLYKTLKEVLKRFEGGMQNIVYFTIESNGVGEGVIAMYENDQNMYEIGACQMISEGSQSGMITSGPSKLKACLQTKEMVETDRLVIRSKDLLREMKTFVKSGSSYKAQYGGTDDLVSATLLAIRMVEHVSQFDINAMNALYQYDNEGMSDDDLLFTPSFL